MPDYIYLLENRLSADQQNALRQLREATREAGIILFLTGDAVRDLTSGHAVRDLEVSVHGNALKLKKTIVKLGGTVWGEEEASRTLYLCFPGTVRVDLISTHRVDNSKLGHPFYPPAPIQDDLRRRDFTVNAMAISLNEGSFGLLMDPLNGAADIESRTLRLVSNYGFIEEPSLLIRAIRYRARLGWELDAKTRIRYENAKGEGVIQLLSAQARSQELEQIGHEDDGLKVLRALEAEGWMNILFPAWTPAKADEEKLKALHELAVELLLQGVHPDMSAAQMELLTAKLAPKDLAALKKLMLRPGFVTEWNSLDALAAGFAKKLLAKENATPSACYKLFTSYDPEAILWLGFTSKDAAVRERFNLFLKVWPEVRQRIPHALMQEMRITPELAAYREIVHSIFLELIDGRLTAVEETRAFLEPHSPPAPPQKETVKRPRVKRSAEAKVKEHSYDDEESEDDLDEDEDLDDLGVDIGGDEAEIGLVLSIPKARLDEHLEEDESEEAEPVRVKRTAKPSAPVSKPPAQASKLPGSAPKPLANAKAVKASPVLAPPPASVKPASAKLAPAKEEKPVGVLPVASPAAAKPKKVEKLQPAAKAEPKSKAELKPKAEAKLKTEPKPKAEPKLASAAKSPHAVEKPAKAKAKPEVKQSAAKVPAKPAGKAPAKSAVKVSAKPAVKVSAKSVVKVAAKPAAKVPVKAAVKVAAKPAVKATQSKGKPTPAASSKGGHALPSKHSHPSKSSKSSKPAAKVASSKPSKQATKAVSSKSGKKR